MEATKAKNPTDKITSTTTIMLDWRDRLRVLFGYRIDLRVTNEIEFTGSEFGPFRAKCVNESLSIWYPKPNWLKSKGGEVALSAPTAADEKEG